MQYWLPLWIKRLSLRPRSLWVRIHVSSPMVYFSDHRRTFTSFNDDRLADPFEPGWLLKALPKEHRMREMFQNIYRRPKYVPRMEFKYLNVELVADRFPGRYEETVLLKSWSAEMDENMKKMVDLPSHNWPKRLGERLHCVPRELQGMI
jgi:hypothetical protein